MKYLVVIESKTNTVVKKFNITHFSESQILKLDLGVTRNMSLEYQTRMVSEEELSQMKKE